MNSKPTERCLKVTEADAMAAVERDDYQWLVDNLFIPALAACRTQVSVFVRADNSITRGDDWRIHCGCR
jgi:hypothetical protein